MKESQLSMLNSSFILLHPVLHISKNDVRDIFLCSSWVQSQKGQNDLCSFPKQTIQYQLIQVYALTSNAEEAEVEWFYEDIQDLLELTSKKMSFSL